MHNSVSVKHQDKAMNESIDWFCKVIRVAGASFPVTASLVQLQAEIDNIAMSERIRRFEDPISYLHEDVAKVSQLVFDKLVAKGSIDLNFDDSFYLKYSRALATLDKSGYISLNRELGYRIPISINLSDPTFILYLCSGNENSLNMESLIETVDKCLFNNWLNGKEIESNLKIPMPVVNAVFEIYEAKGYGFIVRECGIINYCGKC